MNDRVFVDYYELLQLSSNASAETLERVYRLLAKRYHPDNQSTGDSDRFTEIQRAFEVLSDPERRAAYDAQYEKNRGRVWAIFDEASGYEGHDQDRRIFHGILSLLYTARRRDVRHPGLGDIHLERMLGCPREHLEFPIWYLKQRKWIEVLENGQLAITVDGVDKVMDREFDHRSDRLLPESRLNEASNERNIHNVDTESAPQSGGSEGTSVSEDEAPEGTDFLDEAFADEKSPV